MLVEGPADRTTDRTTGAKLFKAAHDGDTEEVITLLSTQGVQRFINYQNSVWRTPLSMAIFGGHSTVTKELIKARCDVDLKAEDGGTALHIAAQSDGSCNYPKAENFGPSPKT